MGTKSSILFIISPIHSHIVPSMYVAEQLKHGFEIYYTVKNENIRRLVDENGFKYLNHSDLHVMLNQEPYFVSKIKKQKLSFLRLSYSYLSNEVFEFRKQELKEIVEKISCSTVVIDIFRSTDFLVLKSIKKDIKVVFFNPMLSLYSITKQLEKQAWNNKLNQYNLLDIFKQPKKFYFDYLNQVQYKKILNEAGISSKGISLIKGFTFLFKDIPEIIAAPIEIEPPNFEKKDWQHFLGLCINTKTKDKLPDNLFSEMWKNILAQKGKLIYCSFGTFYNGVNRPLLNFVKNIIASINYLENKEIQVIISVNRFIIETIQHTEKINSNIHLFTYVPQLEVLEKADIFITHGGLGSIKESIKYKVPMLVYPLDTRYDQPENGLRIEQKEIGLRGNFYFEKTDDLKNKIIELLNNPKYKLNIELLHKKISSTYLEKNICKILQ